MIYEIDKSGEKEPLKLSPSALKSQGWDELKFQGYLFKHLAEFVGPDLYVISQSKKGQEQPDLVALDRFGDLWIFELKAITGSSENLLQALRYSQIYGFYTIDDLDSIYRAHKDTPGSLITDFCQYYGYTTPGAVLEWAGKMGKKHHLVVVCSFRHSFQTATPCRRILRCSSLAIVQKGCPAQFTAVPSEDLILTARFYLAAA
jgi:hypothetical protein